MKKVLVATEKPFAPIAIKGIREVIEAAGYQLELLEKYTAKEQLLQAVADADAIIIRSDIVDAEVIDAAKKLKLVVRAGAGYDNIDLAAATAHGICAMNTPGQNANAVAELAIGLMIYAQRNMYNGASGTELRGKNLGLHAYGNVARAVARIAEGMGMNIYVYDPYTSQEAVSANGHTKVDTVQELYSTCNIVSLHIPATPETKQSIGRDLVGAMPKGALLVNTARKEVINEPELLALMSERTDIKYFTDIAPAALEDFKNCQGRFFAPPKKMGAQTAEANINAGIAAARQIVAFFENGDERFRVNK
ncbi:MAG: 3-phosphoglycerate dehydrogenase [Bacteroidaceae bacterium]|nr:3-phosphoglycerate dehydrogenase [Bacteroidaceae bacterium]